MRSPHRQKQKSPSCGEDSTAKNKSINNFKKLEGVFIKKKKKGFGQKHCKAAQRGWGRKAEDTEGKVRGWWGTAFGSLRLPSDPTPPRRSGSFWRHSPQTSGFRSLPPVVGCLHVRFS